MKSSGAPALGPVSRGTAPPPRFNLGRRPFQHFRPPARRLVAPAALCFLYQSIGPALSRLSNAFRGFWPSGLTTSEPSGLAWSGAGDPSCWECALSFASASRPAGRAGRASLKGRFASSDYCDPGRTECPLGDPVHTTRRRGAAPALAASQSPRLRLAGGRSQQGHHSSSSASPTGLEPLFAAARARAGLGAQAAGVGQAPQTPPSRRLGPCFPRLSPRAAPSQRRAPEASDSRLSVAGRAGEPCCSTRPSLEASRSFLRPHTAGRERWEARAAGAHRRWVVRLLRRYSAARSSRLALLGSSKWRFA